MLSAITILLALILVNGVFAMAEMAVVSSRKTRLRRLAHAGQPGAARALDLAEDPGRFLSTIQVGITTIGVLAGAIGEAGIAGAIEEGLRQVPVLAPHADQVALLLMVVAVTYVSLIVGELVPKRLALLRPEVIAMRLARPMHYLSAGALPLVRLLGASTDLVLRLLRARPPEGPSVTEEEIKVLMEQGTEEGVFEPAERRFVENVLRLDSRRVGSIMTPRIDVVFIDPDQPLEVSRQRILESAHAELPVSRDGLDHVVGFLSARNLLNRLLRGEPFDLVELTEPALYVPEGLSLMQVLEQLRAARRQTALVVDEYGDVVGLVSLTDVLEAIVGALPPQGGEEEAEAVLREDGTWLIDGRMDLHEFKQRFRVDVLPGEESAEVNTVGGLVMLALGRVPRVTDTVETAGLRIEVVDMDRHRVDKVLVKAIADTAGDPERGETGS